MSRNARGEDEVDREVSSRLSSINGYESRGAGRIGSRALQEASDSKEITPLSPAELDELDEDRVPADTRDQGGDERGGDERGADEWDRADPADGAGEDELHPAVAQEVHDRGSEDWHNRLRAVDVHHVTFPRAPLTRRGYDERSVDEFLSRVEAELVMLVGERADLRDRVARLERQARRSQGAPVPQMEEAQAQSVRLLAKAQQLADQYVAEAEDYSKRIAQDARQQYDDLVAEARATAARVVEEAGERAAAMLQEAEEAAREAAVRAAEALPPAATAATPAGVDAAVLERTETERQSLEEQVAYLRTFGQVCRTQLRAYLEALLQDVEDEWGKADPAVAQGTRPGGQPRRPRAGGSSPGRGERGRQDGGPEQPDEPETAAPVHAGRGA